MSSFQPLALALVLLLPLTSNAVCPSDCVGGGGPPQTDCIVSWGGISSTTTVCTDGDPSCDTDGQADGVCTIALAGCVNVGSAGCTAGPLDGAPTVKPSSNAAAQALAGALGTLTGAGPTCTSPGFAVPLKVGISGIKPGKVTLAVTAASGGKRDKDRLKFTCLPSATSASFSQVVQPLLTERCATATCHPAGGQTPFLDSGAYQDVVNQPSSLPSVLLVKPGSLKSSYVARKILGQGKFFGTTMPQGCPGLPPEGGCLTASETYTILSWIQNGAPNN